MKINDIIVESYDENIHSWVVMITGIDIGQLSEDVDELYNNTSQPKQTIDQLEQILEDVRNIFEDNNFWAEASKFGNIKTDQLASEFIELENRIERYIKELSRASGEPA